ncbi:DUF1289 domain-containing protein [Sphingobium sufflavum]|uniref:DUF1289 domain-containing protein n=1 Tax=Sphingobium sufflavum TaxID=1129547 RepID=UPI001F405E37|nr:DUF1289 domain-containing protein [Sphingobium sufflavum]MCE7797171.1 DUF1289 domain-containing protein [Sphingobium sufflavum]
MTVRSPCIGACRIAPDTGWCVGCARTLAEITAWGGAGDAWRATVVAALPDRLGRAASRNGSSVNQKTSLAIKSQ